MEEIWKDIEGYDGVYQISTFGRVRKKVKTKNGYDVLFMQPSKAKGERYYYIVKLSKNNKKTTHFIHRLVAQAFIPNPDKLPQVNHKDENPANNCADNLEWCTTKENNRYGSRGLRFNEITVLNPDGSLYKEFDSLREASAFLGISRKTIMKFCNNEKQLFRVGGKNTYFKDYTFINKEGL